MTRLARDFPVLAPYIAVVVTVILVLQFVEVLGA